MKNNPRLAARNPEACLSHPARNNPMRVPRREAAPQRAPHPPRALAARVRHGAGLGHRAARIALLGTSEGALAPFRGEALRGDVSTPVSEWTRGQVPHLYQTDPAWASAPPRRHGGGKRMQGPPA